MKRLNISPVGQLPPKAKKVSRKLKLLNNKHINTELYNDNLLITLENYLSPIFLTESSGTIKDWNTSAAIILDHKLE